MQFTGGLLGKAGRVDSVVPALAKRIIVVLFHQISISSINHCPYTSKVVRYVEIWNIGDGLTASFTVNPALRESTALQLPGASASSECQRTYIFKAVSCTINCTELRTVCKISIFHENFISSRDFLQKIQTVPLQRYCLEHLWYQLSFLETLKYQFQTCFAIISVNFYSR